VSLSGAGNGVQGIGAGGAAGRACQLCTGTLPRLPPLRSPDDAAAVRGQVLFDRADVGCSGCHSGPLFTNNQNTPVGKGDALQVPSLLGVAWRTPLMHDGCAATLRDRFDPACGGSAHGDVSMLSEGELSDLIAYLESL
jgi:hypothetical protein